ncbi:hypothetical protein BHM03_00050802 [Ensete ventricosum]|uniref:Uncharacterized protein n=1 Tax=Ensete ventricosum TaxID=4639 RepID=A0A445MLM0_ENSVE|nr:hypothetical protein BHM03_00050802 [Ensete ventricosum]
MRRNLDDVINASSSFPRRLRRGEGDEEKTTAKKSSPRKVLSTVSRFFSRRRLRPSAKNAAKKKLSRCLAVRGQRRPRFSLFLFLLPCFFSLFLVVARLIPPDSGPRRSKSTVTDLFWAITGRKQPQSMYRPVADSLRTSLLADWYVPPGTGGTIQYCRHTYK